MPTPLALLAPRPELLGRQPFSNFSASLIYRMSSGLPYFWSPSFQFDFQAENNRRYPLESTTDLRLEKRMRYFGYNMTLGMRVLNLFDNQHLTPISNAEELDRWVLRSATLGDPDDDPTRDVRRYNYFQTFKNIPRQVFFTFGFTF